MIIGINGKAGSGKDTIGDRLVSCHNFKRDNLAAPLKRLVEDVFVIDPAIMKDRARREQPLPNWPPWTPRKLLQYIGTEMFRSAIGEDVWVKSLCMRIQKAEPADWVITDVRFPNELDGLRRVFGNNFRSIRVDRPGHNGAPSGIANHASEAYALETDVVIVNSGTLDDLYQKVDKFMLTAFN